MNTKELARLFYAEVRKIAEKDEASHSDRTALLYQLMALLFLELTKAEKISFSTLFARLTYACQKFNFSRQQQFYLHHFRKLARYPDESDDTLRTVYQLGLKTLADAISTAFGEPIPDKLAALLPDDSIYPEPHSDITSFQEQMRVVATADEPETHQLTVWAEEFPDKPFRLQYNLPERNENFNDTIDRIRMVFQFPVVLSLLDVEIDRQATLRPRGMVVEPDYLMDVTAVAESFKGGNIFLPGYWLRKYLPFLPTLPLIAGHIANFFLDELMRRPELTFKELFPRVFRLNPLAFALFDDRQIRELSQRCQVHFISLKQLVLQGFAENDLRRACCSLEPSFYSKQYGLQGRLDALFQEPGKKTAIVELKSGKPFRPNIYGLNHNHFVQTLLYDLLIKSVFGRKTESTNYILYSQQPENPLRYAPPIKAQQMEALQVRNQLLATEKALTQLDEWPAEKQAQWFSFLLPGSHPNAKGYILRDLMQFQEVFQGMDELEKMYFTSFSSFIAREHLLAKTGVQGLEGSKGQAALWLNSSQEKETQFEILRQLELVEDHSREDDPHLIFRRTEATNPLANFRQGDIVVLYPAYEREDNALQSRIFKCSIAQIGQETITLQLRSSQFNAAIFEEHDLWNIEHDLFDSSFIGMYRQLFALMQAPRGRRDLLLSRRPPERSPMDPIELPGEVTREQGALLQKMLEAQDYFLLWGPPGTGKTSVVLKHLVAYLWQNTEERLLLMAYTNRAVDEICEALEKIDPLIRATYLRIGSRLSTPDRFKKQLLEHKIANASNRQELRSILAKHRIYVSTVASITHKQELFELLSFDRVIIDEASQILEPMLAGMLVRFPRFILIGDHQQLPAVVVQDKEASRVDQEPLNEIGLVNRRDALFERLLRQAKANEWHWAYGQLSYQGRMHQDVMAFSNQYFYNNLLQILPPEISYSVHQQKTIGYTLPPEASDLEKVLCSRRVLFIPTAVDEDHPSVKTNRHEAEMVSRLVQAFQRIFAASQMSSDLGVITPYRAQIAQIRKALFDNSLSLEGVTVDTVERYQGSARDVIIISLCTNSFSQLDSLINLSEEGVDRKLNVALTRARHHLIMLGCPDVLLHNPTYRDFIERYLLESE